MAVNGLTSKTKKKAEELEEKYTPDMSVQAAKHASSRALAAKPDKYSSPYAAVSEQLLSDYLEREPYDFNINTSELYARYADQYKKQGKEAMRDVIADASALTGGYGSSYAAAAGSIAYQSYLDKLNDIVPQIEQQEYERYLNKKADVKDKLDTVGSMENAEYSKYRDELSDYFKDRDFYNDQYRYEADSDREEYEKLLDYILSIATLENNDYYKQAEQRNTQRELDMRRQEKDREFEIQKAKILQEYAKMNK